MISVVVPCYNEAEGLESTYRALADAAAEWDEPFELLLVDDGSTDETWPIIQWLSACDAQVSGLQLSRNFGHQAAVGAGMEAARGNAVVVIDADLQDPPELIGQFIAKWREGYEVVYAVRAEREGETWFKLFTARLFYRIIQALTDVTIPMEAGDFRLLDRSALDVLKQMRERNRFVRAMVSWIGFRQIGVPYKRHARTAGETKYTFRKMLRLSLDATTGFSMFPLKLAQWAGSVAVGLGILLALVLLVIRLGGVAPLAGQGLTVSLVLFMGGVQLLGMGILGEYIGRIYDEIRNRPLYIVRSIKQANKRVST